ncbi:hypothetical protein ACQUJV_21955 [Ralstonia pseudosolanacearum]
MSEEVLLPEERRTSVVEYRPYPRGALLKMSEGRGKFSYWRYLGYWEETDQIFMLAVTPGTSPKNCKLPKAWMRSKLAPRFGVDVVLVHDCVRFDFMDTPLEELTYEKGQQRRRDITSRFAPIRHLVNDANFMAVVANKKDRAALVKKAVKNSGVDESTLRHHLTIFWWFGCDKTAMIPLHERKGGAGKKRSEFGRKKTGPRPAAYLESGAKIDLGVQRNPLLVREIHRAIDEYVIKKDMSYNQAWERYRDYDCVASTSVDGEIVHSRDARRAASSYQFYRIGKEYLDSYAKRKAKVGEDDARDKLTARNGHATDILDHSKQVLILDGTGLPVYLVRDTDTFVPIGRATGLFGICCASGALVGQYIWPNAESADAYRYCIFNALSDKKQLAEDYGLVSSEGLPRGDWDAVFVDRGPAISEPFKETIVASLRMSRELTESYRGQAKGPIESYHAFLENEIRELPGAYTRRVRTRDKKKRDEAAGLAVLTLEELRKCAILAQEKFNLYSDATLYYTSEMRDAKIPLNRAEILGYLQGWRRGDAATHWSEEELLLRLLPFVQRKNQEGYVKIGSSTYYSDALKETWENTPKLMQRGKIINPTVYVCQLPGTTNMIVWRKSDGSFDYPRISKRDFRRYGDFTPQYQRLVARPIDIARAQKNKRKRNGNGKVRREQLANLEAHAARRQKEKLPLAAMTGMRENRSQAIAESNQQLGRRMLRTLNQHESPSNVPDAFNLAADQVYEQADDMLDLFDKSFEG